MKTDAIKTAIRDIPDFPQKGVLFRDITPVLADAALFRQAVGVICSRHARGTITKVAAVEARGFIFGATAAMQLGAGFVPVRKKGKLPFRTIEESYDLEYGSATIAMHVDALAGNDKVLIVDDLLATGGTAEAAASLVRKSGAQIVEIAFLVELAAFKGREKLAGYPVFSAITY